MIPTQLWLYHPNRCDSPVPKKDILVMGGLHSSEEVTKIEAATKMSSALSVCLSAV